LAKLPIRIGIGKEIDPIDRRGGLLLEIRLGGSHQSVRQSPTPYGPSKPEVPKLFLSSSDELIAAFDFSVPEQQLEAPNAIPFTSACNNPVDVVG
jgi:hypothetical protein